MKSKIKWLPNMPIILCLLFITTITTLSIPTESIDAKEIAIKQIVAIVNGELITSCDITIWRTILGINNGDTTIVSPELFLNDSNDNEFIAGIIDIHLLAREAAKQIEARENPKREFIEKIAYWSQLSSWLNATLKNIKKGEKSLSVKMSKEEKLIAELLRIYRDPGWMKTRRFIRENAARLGISGDSLRNYLIKLSLAEKCREFWKEDVERFSYVSPKEAREYYETHAIDFQIFRHVVFSEKGFNGDVAKTEKMVGEICIAIDKGVSFENLGIDNFQEFSCATIGDFMPAIQELGLGLLQLDNAKVGYKKSDLGWHVVQLQPPKSFQDAQKEIFAKLQRRKSEEKTQELLQTLRGEASIIKN